MEDVEVQPRQRAQDDVKEKVMELAKRRGFLWPSYEIYGGVAGHVGLWAARRDSQAQS